MQLDKNEYRAYDRAGIPLRQTSRLDLETGKISPGRLLPLSEIIDVPLRNSDGTVSTKTYRQWLAEIDGIKG